MSPVEEKFSVAKRAKSFAHAGRGLWVFVRATHNAWIHLAALGLVVGLGIFFQISLLEWVPIIFAAGLVIVAEEFNTAIEIDMNLTSPEMDPRARDTKDVAAGAVLTAAIVAVLIGIFIFAPHLVQMFA